MDPLLSSTVIRRVEDALVRNRTLADLSPALDEQKQDKGAEITPSAR
jgi:hypothetical protein